MRVMVMRNIEMDLDITNGAHSEITEIVLHPDEPLIGNQAVVELKYLPLYILVKLTWTWASPLEGLAESVIPLEPTAITKQIQVKTTGGKTMMQTVQQKQFPMTATYTFTDYQSQGQMLLCILVDIATPPSSTLSLFNLYIALSRGSG